MTLGYITGKTMPEYSFPKLTFEFCNKTHFAWNHQPTSPTINSFISKEYDVLIDLTPSEFFHVKYLVSQSPAHFKVGRYAEKYVDLYDMMIQVDDQCSLQETINHTIHYLKMINNGNDQ
jgi:hypothetical protein